MEERLAPGAWAAVRPRAGVGHSRVVYRVTKRGLSTPEVQAALARALGVDPRGVKYAGLKDKHAVTVQHFTVEARRPARGAGAGSLGAAGQVAHDEPEVTGRGWSGVRVGYTSFDITAEWIERNVFTIVARAVSPAQRALIEQRAASLSDGAPAPGAASRRGRCVAIVNYFGDQRFGSARHGQGFAARALLSGDAESALRLLIGTPARKDSGPRRVFTRALAQHWGRWDAVMPMLPAVPERASVAVLARGGTFTQALGALPRMLRAMCIDAYQSHLWNEVARRVLAANVDPAVCWRAPGIVGDLVFAPWASVPAPLRALRVPTLGLGVDLGQDAGQDSHAASAGAAPAGEWRVHAAGVLRDEGLEPARLRIAEMGLDFPTYERALMVQAERFEMATLDERGSVRFSFALPRGCFGTVVLRALGV